MKGNNVILGPFEALLFDMDGTLLTSIGAVERAWSAWARRIGAPVDDVLHYMHGRRAVDTIAHFSPPTADIEKEVAWLDAREHEDQEGVKEIPDARRLLSSLPAHRWAIVTSANSALARRRLETAGLPMPDILVASEHVAVGKPHPEGYRRAAGLMGVDINRCLAFEDTRSGIEAVIASGAYPVRIGTQRDFDGPDTLCLRDYRHLQAIETASAAAGSCPISVTIEEGGFSQSA
ncbi:sugar-phosphatase [Rhizobium aquaticum]|uniref:Sugar-phosphatase n=1 Tax=Rhizobium aquaticum TaxID=1549636 RepID=A0ABV2J490_9HYPH